MAEKAAEEAKQVAEGILGRIQDMEVKSFPERLCFHDKIFLQLLYTVCFTPRKIQDMEVTTCHSVLIFL